MSRINFSLKITIIAIGVIAAFTTFVSVAYHYSIENQKNRILNNFANYSEILSHKIQAQFYERYADVQAFAINAVFQNLSNSRHQATLNELVELYRIYDLIIIVDKDGKLISHNSFRADQKLVNSEKLGSMDFKQMGWFEAALSENWTVDKQNGFTGTYVENPHRDPILEIAFGDPTLGTSFTSVIRSESGEILAVISARSNPSWIEDEVKAVYHSTVLDGYVGTEVQIINRKGYLVVDYAPLRQNGEAFSRDFDSHLLKTNLADLYVEASLDLARGQPGRGFSFHQKRQIMQIGGWTPINGSKFIESLGWGVVVKVDPATLYSHLNQAKLWFILGSILFGTISLLIFFAFLRSSMKVSEVAIRESLEISSEIRRMALAVAQTSLQLQQNTATTSASIEESSASLTELTSMVDQNASESERSAHLASLSLESGQQISILVDTLNSQAIELDQNSRKVSQIVTTIEDVAVQTNLLALNASVEAARAGDQGRGFAVVAEAVRELATRSSEQVKIIENLIQKNKISALSLNEGVKLLNSEYQKILHNLTQSKNSAEMIFTASREQANGLSQISMAVNSQDKGVHSNVQLAEHLKIQADKTTELLSEQKNKLNKIQNLFFGYTEGD